MYQFSRAIYREIATRDRRVRAAAEAHEARPALLRAVHRAPGRPTATTSPGPPARCSTTSGSTSRCGAQARVWRVVSAYLACADEWLARQPRQGYDATGNPLQCRATTRRGTACQRDPLPHNGYCPSHQHLAETEERELVAA